MFWRFGGYANISTLDSILDKPDVTTEELLEESDLIQELKQQNSKLIEFLRDDAVLKKLLDYVVTDAPPADAPVKDKVESPKAEEREGRHTMSFFGGKGKGRSRSKSSGKGGEGESEAEKKEEQRKKYAYVSAEVLSSEVWSITEAVLEQREHLSQFWQYLYRPAPLDPLQAGYFTKVNEALLDKKTEEMLAFFKSLDGVLPAMLQHVDCPMVMDLLLKIISLEKHEGGAGIVDWLQSQQLIPLLLGYLSPEHNSATQTSAGDFLKAIITISANATTQDQSVIGPNELTRELVSEKCIQILISNMLQGGNPLTVGVGIIIEVIRKNNSDYDMENQIGPVPKTSDPIYLGTLLRQFANHVPLFMHLIRSPSAKKPNLKAAFGTSIEPLGFDRFKTCELMAELLHCSNMGLLNDRGAEDEVRKRDAKREQLKKEGKLGKPSQENSHEEFGSSVDSHGFHHAERPSDGEAEVLSGGNDEDGFEKVSKPSTDDFPDEASFDDDPEDEKPTSPKTIPSPVTTDVPKPLSPAKPTSPIKQNLLHFDPPPTHSVDSPTTAGVTDRIRGLDVDEDTVMTEFGEEDVSSDEDGPSELERALAEAEKPAPLFAGGTSDAVESEQERDIDESIATIQGESAVENGDGDGEGARPEYETEEDGSPVVGDLLKIQFVECRVVPTILDFFFRFPWNNFLHNVVYDVVQQVFNGTLDRGYNKTLAFDLFSPIPTTSDDDQLGLFSTKALPDRILDGQRASDKSAEVRGMRLGYMGHLTLIAEEVCKFGNRHPPDVLDKAVVDAVNHEDWTAYVEGTLAETRDKDNAVLGGVRPQDSIGVRHMQGGNALGGIGGAFSAGTASTLANAGLAPQDSMALAEGSVGQSFEIQGGTSGFGDDEGDEEMEGELGLGDGGRRGEVEDEDDEQTQSPESTATASIPPPLNIPPSRARQQLAKRLAQKKAEAAEASDPDAADHAALETASALPEEGLIAPESPTRGGLQITGVSNVARGSASRFSGLFGGSDDSSEDSDEGDAGRDVTLGRAEGDYEDEEGEEVGAAGWRRALRENRRPSTTEAKERTPLSDDEDGDGNGREDAELERSLNAKLAGPVAGKEEDSSDEEELVEMMPRRTS